MADVRIVRVAELKAMGLPAPCDRVEVPVKLDELARLKIHYRRPGSKVQTVFANSEELLVRFPFDQGEVLYYFGIPLDDPRRAVTGGAS